VSAFAWARITLCRSSTGETRAFEAARSRDGLPIAGCKSYLVTLVTSGACDISAVENKVSWFGLKVASGSTPQAPEWRPGTCSGYAQQFHCPLAVLDSGWSLWSSIAIIWAAYPGLRSRLYYRHQLGDTPSQPGNRRVMSSTLRRQQQLVPELNNLLDTTSIDDFDAS
jgi:hypothetical protein